MVNLSNLLFYRQKKNCTAPQQWLLKVHQPVKAPPLCGFDCAVHNWARWWACKHTAVNCDIKAFFHQACEVAFWERRHCRCCLFHHVALKSISHQWYCFSICRSDPGSIIHSFVTLSMKKKTVGTPYICDTEVGIQRCVRCCHQKSQLHVTEVSKSIPDSSLLLLHLMLTLRYETNFCHSAIGFSLMFLLQILHLTLISIHSLDRTAHIAYSVITPL